MSNTTEEQYVEQRTVNDHRADKHDDRHDVGGFVYSSVIKMTDKQSGDILLHIRGE